MLKKKEVKLNVSVLGCVNHYKQAQLNIKDNSGY